MIGLPLDAGMVITGTTLRIMSLSETGLDRGVLEGRLPSSPNSSSQNVIAASRGRLLTATHSNPYSPLTATARATFTAANRPPVANDDAATLDEDGAVDVPVLANDSDPDGDTLSVESITQPTHGTATINADKTVNYTPAANYNGSDSFTYTISDG